MKNPFDQFDGPQVNAPQQANPFDQFDTSPSETSDPNLTMRRYTGLAGRAVVNGITSMPGAIVDFPSKLVDATKGAIRDFTSPEEDQVAQEARQGGTTPLSPYPSQLAQEMLNKGMDAAGLPTPNTSGERVGSDIVSALAGAKQMMGGSAPDSLLRTAPGMQYLSSGAGAGASGITRENGGSEGTQIAAGMLAGVGAPVAAESAYQLAKGITNAVPALTQPFTQGGREKIVGSALNRLSTNPETAMDNLGNAQEFVPGSPPTTGVASSDYGLLSAEKGLRNSDPAAFAERASHQNTARGILLDGIAQNESALNAAKTSRDEITGQLRDNAFANASAGQVDSSAIKQSIDALKDNPDNAGQTVQKALSWANDLIDGKTDPRALYAARKDVGYAMDGKLAGDGADFKLARKQLTDVKSTIDTSLEKAAPGFTDYLSKYKEMSAPINQMEAGQDIAARTGVASPDTTGRSFLSQAKWKNVVDSNKTDLAKVMTPDQMNSLNAITADLDRGATINNSAIKAAGSDTVQNLTTANLIGNVLGKNNISPLTQNIARPLAWIYQLPDHAIHKLLVDAMLDPAMARGFMAKATPQNVVNFGAELKRRAIAYPLGASTGTAVTTQNGQQ